MFIFLVLLNVATVLRGMQVYQDAEKHFINHYIHNAFNVGTPQSFDAYTICTIYESPNLIENIQKVRKRTIDELIQIGVDQVGIQQLQKNYFDITKKNEFIFMYASFLESFVRFFPKIVKAIKYHCTLPLSYAVQKKLLKKLWYGHWNLCLPLKIEKLYKEGIILQFIVGQQKELLNNFKLQCMENKNFSIDVKSISCYALSMNFAEKFLLLADELNRQKHTQVEDQKKLALICTNAVEVFQQLPSCMESLRPWVAKFKKHTKREIKRREIIAYFLEWWGDFWNCPHGKPNYKTNRIKDLNQYAKDKVMEYNNNVHV